MLLRQEVSGLNARGAASRKSLAEKQARNKPAEAPVQPTAAEWPEDIGTSIAAKRRELLQTEHQLETGVAETRAAAKTAEDAAHKSIATLQRQLHDLQDQTDSSFRDTPKNAGKPASER